MRVGYACLTIGVVHTDYRKILMKQVTNDNLRAIISYNLQSLKNVILYNISNEIKLFRISSDLIPFGSSPVNPLRWWEDYASELAEIGRIIQEAGMRVSVHPGQYTVINSPHQDVVQRAVADLEYHAQILESLGVDDSHKIILHIGGVYLDKQKAIQQFVLQFQQLSKRVQKRLVIENDDKSYHIEDVLAIHEMTGIPVVYDNLHHQINPSPSQGSDAQWIATCARTWKKQDGRQKIHYSQQAVNKRPGSHSTTIFVDPFMEFYNTLMHRDIDIMLEVKDKNLSAIKIHRLLHSAKKIGYLEEEWRLYKYLVLEASQQHYQQIRTLLKNKDAYPVLSFYQLLEQALLLPENKGQALNAIMHVWGYVKKLKTEKQGQQYLKLISQYQQQTISLNRIKRFLEKMMITYHQDYMTDSYYFIDRLATFEIEGS